MSFEREALQLCNWGTLMPSKHHMPQLFLKILWTRRTWGQYKMNPQIMFLTPRLTPLECREAQRLKGRCVDILCECCDSLGDEGLGCVAHGAQTFDSAMRMLCQTTPEHEPGSPCKDAGHLCPHTRRVWSNCSANFASFPFSYSHPPCKITQPCQPWAAHPFSLPNPQFLLFQLFTVDEEEQDYKKKK